MKVKLVISIILLALGGTSGMAQSKTSDSNDVCYRWRTQVDPSTQRIVIDESVLSDLEVEEGIGCLLELKGLKGKARFQGDTRANYNKSEQYRPHKKSASIEIAALYYASYLFENNWEHADAVVLVDDVTGKTNTNALVERAYKSYQAWFTKVVRMGLKRSRERNLDPLKGSGVRWL